MINERCGDSLRIPGALYSDAINLRVQAAMLDGERGDGQPTNRSHSCSTAHPSCLRVRGLARGFGPGLRLGAFL